MEAAQYRTSRDPFVLGNLEDRESFHGTLDVTGADPAILTSSLSRMILIRRAEEIISDHVQSGEIRCPCHLAIGQEACAVGVVQALRAGDRSFGAHRSHGHYLALGGSVHKLFAEVLGRDTGVSRGMGGSMHLIDRSIGLFGTVPIVGATIPIAVGAGLASKRSADGSIAASFFGDGAAEEGAFHESMNLAAILKLPVLFVCENNFFSSHLHIRLRQPYLSISRYAAAHGVEWRRVDGNNVLEVFAAATDLVEKMRAGGGPGFLELVTYRWKGHVGWRDDEDVGVARNIDLPIWRKRDPIQRLADGMLQAGLITTEAVSTLAADAEREVTDAWNRAKSDPFPSAPALLERLYSNDRDRAKRDRAKQ